jgi:hypothetical protein
MPARTRLLVVPSRHVRRPGWCPCNDANAQARVPQLHVSHSACYGAPREIANRWSATLQVTERVSGSTTRDRGWIAPPQVTDHSAASSRPVIAKVVVAPSVGVAAYVLSRSVDDVGL